MLLLFSFPFSALSEEMEICSFPEPWKLPVCGTTNEERALKSEHFHNQLEASLLRKKILPEEVTEAGKAVFRIGIQYSHLQWSWNFSGGSGSFMFDNRTFVTAYHVVEPLLSYISDWNEVVFKDQNGNQHEFKIKGVRFVSRLRDIAVLEVAGYEGPFLEPSTEPIKEQSYILGYSEEFKIQSVQAFQATNILYGAFVELFDCYYGFNFGGSSGGPLLNKKGKVKAVFTNLIDSPFTGCPFLLARKMDFLTEEIQNNQIYDSIEKAKELMLLEENKIAELAMEGNMDAKLELLLDAGEPFNSFEEIKEALRSDNGILQYFLIHKIASLQEQKIKIPPFITEIIDEKISSSKPQDLLSVNWYNKGLATYYDIDADLETACEFWDKARQTGHPLVHSDFVIVPSDGDIISCKL